MTAKVDVIVDRDDDIATVKAIRALAAREPGVLAVSIGCSVPEAARPILGAIEERHEHEPILDIPWPDPGESRAKLPESDDALEMPPAVDREFAMALGRLLDGRKMRVPCRDLSRPVRSRFEALRADGILDRRHRVYRVSHIALSSSFRVDNPADPSADKRMRRIAVIS